MVFETGNTAGYTPTEQAALVAEVDELLADVLGELDDDAATARAIRRCDGWGDIAAAALADGLTGLADQLRLAEANWWELQP